MDLLCNKRSDKRDLIIKYFSNRDRKFYSGTRLRVLEGVLRDEKAESMAKEMNIGKAAVYHHINKLWRIAKKYGLTL